MGNSAHFSVIVLAAGAGRRMDENVPKQYLPLGHKTVLYHTLMKFMECENLDRICVVINPEHEELFTTAVIGLENIEFCFGGSERINSVYNGIKYLSNLKNEDIILVHDAARPFVRSEDIQSALDAMESSKAASLAAPIADTLRYGQDGITRAAVERNNLYAMQTPQAFQYEILRQAHESADTGKAYTDDTALVSELGIDVKIIQSSKMNFKITTKEDYDLAQNLIKHEVFIGQGFDVHAFDDSVDAQHITLCGVEIPYNRKLKGHSDADVGLHALTDAILGAIGEGDIGLHFPPSNMDFKDMDSAVFLEHAMKLLKEKGGFLINADITLICEEPKVGKYRQQIIERVSDILDIEKRRINIKATTTEQLGFTGRKEGIASQVSVSVSLPCHEV